MLILLFGYSDLLLPRPWLTLRATNERSVIGIIEGLDLIAAPAPRQARRPPLLDVPEETEAVPDSARQPLLHTRPA